MQKSLTLAATIALAPAAAYAQLAVNGRTFADLGLGLNAAFVLSGFVNLASVCGTDVSCQVDESNLYVHLDASAVATAKCTNPGGDTPGRHPIPLAAPIAVSGSGAIGGQNFTPPNGPSSWSISIGAGPPTSLTIVGAPDCPNSKWSETISDLAFTSATLSVIQGATLLAQYQTTCAFSPPTTDGPVPAQTVTCR